MHPLAPNLTELKDDELHKKFTELMARLTYASNIGIILHRKSFKG